MTKKERREMIDELAKKYDGLSMQIALVLQTQIDGEKGLAEKIRCLQSGLLGFYLLIKEEEEK